MKQIKYLLVIFMLSIISISCKKSYLDVENSSVILREQYVKDLNSLQQYLNGIYVVLARDFYNATSGPQIYTDIIADDVKPTSNNTNSLVAQYRWNQSATSGSGVHMEPLWQRGYQIIRSCSFTISKGKELSGENGVKANQIMGEAFAMRALTHFVLVNVFAQSYNYSLNAGHPGIPYISGWDWNDPFSRNTVKEVYDGMISDLNSAIPLLTSNNSKIVMNQFAVKALLARVYLFKEDWLQAKTIAAEVASRVPLLASTLYPQKLFTPDETEALFQLAPSSTTSVSGSYTTGFAGFSFRSTSFLATKDIATLLTQKTTDGRRRWISTSSTGIDSIRKYPVNVVSGFGSGVNLARSYYQTLLRSSEMFLIVAEASAKLNDEVTARAYLDAIRQRADPTVTNSTATGSALLESIYLERRKELAFEGFRMWDLLRWKKGVIRIDAAANVPTVLSYPSDRAVAPIPQSDVDYGIPQNPSY